MYYATRLPVIFIAPLSLLLGATLVVPAGIFFGYSFRSVSFRQIQPGLTWENYAAVLTDPLYWRLASNTLLIAVPTTLASVACGYLLAYFLVFHAGRMRGPLLAAIVLSMMASYLVRIYAWRTILGEEGILNSALQIIGATNEPIGLLLFSRSAVVVAQVNIILPFTTLLLYASLTSITRDIREGARDLGAGPLEVVRRIVLPLTGPSLLSAVVFTLFVSAGDFVTPVFLGGTNSATFGTVIADELRITSNFGLGSALSFAMLGGFGLSYVAVRSAMKTLGLLPGSGGDA
jgi:spermidine/putrescine transport system permease protein